MKTYIVSIFRGYAEIFFVQDYRVGIIIVAITLLNPNIALAGMLSVLAAHGFVRFIGMDRTFLELGFYTYNPLLVGCSIGYLFALTPVTILLIIISGIGTVMLTIAMIHLFSTYLKLPVLSLPFVLAGMMLYLATARYTDLSARYLAQTDTLAASLPAWLSGYFQSLGAIFFMPNVLTGLIFALGILAVSRILFFLSLAGYCTGVAFTALLTGSWTQAFTNLNHYNSILVAMAIGGIFLIPSLKSYLLAMIAVCVSTVALDGIVSFWAYASVPGFTLAFNIVTLGFVYVLGVMNSPQLARLGKRTPEETLEFHLVNRHRPPLTARTIMLPFSGKWTVWQGFNGQWTHQGKWQHAYDFVITNEHGETHCNGGIDLNEYYTYRKPVLSPVRGKVVMVVDGLPDNPVGQVDRENNWGNLVIIQDERGFFVELSHFAQDSIRVKEGVWVERGTLLGLCGNSGYSPQPHIHIQVQLTATIGAYTVPFSFTSYSNDHHFHENEQPPEGTGVEPLYWNSVRESITSLNIGDVRQYKVLQDGKHVDDLTLIVRMAQDGTLYFDSGRGKLYFGKRDGSFFFYGVEGNDPYLKTMLLALPRFPLACRPGLEWDDDLPAGIMLNGFLKAITQFISAFSYNAVTARMNARCTQDNRIEGTLHTPILRLRKQIVVEWDKLPGFASIQVDNLELRRV